MGYSSNVLKGDPPMNNAIKLMLAAVLALAFTIEYTFIAAKHITVFTIVLTAITVKAARYLYDNRQQLLDAAGEPFVYHSPVFR